MSFYSAWQPLDDEDAQTALVFAFMRHAPVDYALVPWLADVLGRPVSVEPLEISAFWPSLVSVLDGHERTIPDMAFMADDGAPLLVVVESKLGAGQHGLDQLTREAIDTAHQTKVGRTVLVMVGADIGKPPHADRWEEHIATELAAHGFAEVSVELRYSSWATLGKWIEGCATLAPEWSAYAYDVVEQLRLHGQLGYKGAPVFDDLDGLTVVNAVELVNRTVKQARQYFLALTGHTRFQALGLEPFGRSFEMLRDGAGTRSLNQDEDWFTTSTLFSAFRKPSWDESFGVFAAFFLATEDEPELDAGAFWAEPVKDLQYSFAWSDTIGSDDLENPTLRRLDGSVLSEISEYDQNEWRYAKRSWRPGDPDGDVDWTLAALEAAVAALDATKALT